MKLRSLAFCTAVFSAGIGIGGGCLLVPGIISLSNHPYQKAASTSLCLISITAFIASLTHLYALQQVPMLQYLVSFLPSCLLGSLLAGPFIQKINGKGLKVIFAIFIFLAALKMLGVSNTIEEFFKYLDQIYPPSDLLRVVPFALVVGITATLLGVGCGLVIVPFFVIFMGVKMQSAVLISLTSMFILTSSAAMIHKKFHNICTETVKSMLPFVVVGAFCGTIFSGIMPERLLKSIFAFFLLLTSIKYITSVIYSMIKAPKKI